MRDIHVWHLLAVHVPEPAAEDVPVDRTLPWLRNAAG